MRIDKKILELLPEYKKIVRRLLRIDSKSNKNVPGCIISDPDKCEIGQRVSFGGQVRIFNTASVRIGNDCMIAFGVQIVTATHDYNNNPMWKHRIDRPIEIGNHVWIGTNAIILPGIKIGDYVVIGAGAIVTAHVPDRAVVAGNPARIIKIRDLADFDDTCVYPGVAINKGFLPDFMVMKNK